MFASVLANTIFNLPILSCWSCHCHGEEQQPSAASITCTSLRCPVQCWSSFILGALCTQMYLNHMASSFGLLLSFLNVVHLYRKTRRIVRKSSLKKKKKKFHCNLYISVFLWSLFKAAAAFATDLRLVLSITAHSNHLHELARNIQLIFLFAFWAAPHGKCMSDPKAGKVPPPYGQTQALRVTQSFSWWKSLISVRLVLQKV